MGHKKLVNIFMSYYFRFLSISGCFSLAKITMSDNVDVSLSVGQEFKTFEEFTTYLKVRESVTGEKWMKCSGGRTVNQANKKLQNTDLHFKESFRYSIVNFKCIHGGIHISQATQRNRRSYKLGCLTHMQLCAKRKEDALVITKLHLEHNHELKPLSSDHLYAESIHTVPFPPRKRTKKQPKVPQTISLVSSSVNLNDLVNLEPTSVELTPQSMSLVTSSLSIPLNTAQQQENRVRASEITSELIDILEKCTEDTFKQRCRFLRELVLLWKFENEQTQISAKQNVIKTVLCEIK